MVGKIALVLLGFWMVLSTSQPIEPQNLSTSLTVLPLPIPGKEAITNEEAEVIDLFQLEHPDPGQIITVKCASFTNFLACLKVLFIGDCQQKALETFQC